MSDRLPQLMKLLAVDPEDADVPYMIALEHAKSGDPESAVEWLDKALALDPGYHYAYYQKAKMLSEIGQDEAGLAVLDAGLKRANADGNAKAVGELQELRLAMQ
ncbi:tetratricopeptide repeat protein [Algisphaera agarilytica]|uniref:Tetratricopeptide (TPR) repeat protein n=1 Tax=Algisphaera agarilytica TaxID=1385975 RepID=A0A7X0H6X0_9BACT|nr:tetratricopeptide repeat protein [Algisphaera agarilytica]MBB6430385.1 tetratricopeptide (TPR) repeat protein [Algisphaera agarilytica]